MTALSAGTGQVSGSRSYTAFGAVETADGAQSRYGYTSRELDPSGLMYYRARYYDSASRFLSPDPLGIEVERPASTNLYAYVSNNPVNYVDPSGLIGLRKVARMAAALVALGIFAKACIYPKGWLKSHFLAGVFPVCQYWDFRLLVGCSSGFLR